MKNMLLLLFISLLSFYSCSDSTKKSSKEGNIETYYTCSMHPQIREHKPGKCPICGMGLTKIEIEKSSKKTKKQSKSEVKRPYYCQSDPSVKSRFPGECPLDGSAMLKETVNSRNKEVLAQVNLRKSQISHFRANTFKVTSMKMKKEVRLLGTLIKSENKESNIPARIAGRVEEVFVESSGIFIKKGAAVLKIYSPKLISGGEEFLISLKNYQENKNSKEFKEIYFQTRERLKLWGVTDHQLDEWAKKQRIPRSITIYSPVTGIVDKKYALKGRYFKEGESFFDLVDLSSIWVEMDVYEQDSALVSTGQKVRFEFGAYPGETWSGEINFINPVLNANTRTLKVRSTLKNEEGKLMPGMVGTANLTLKLQSPVLVVPRTAIIDTGKRQVVWVKLGDGQYGARKVHTGFESMGHVEIKHGLKAGEEVVFDGNFMLDAQAQLFGAYEDKQDLPSTSSGHQH